MMHSGWRTINIFLSSTFSDMQAERDVVRKIVVPRLNEKLQPYKTSVLVTDLRWGIDTTGNEDESEREAKVLHVCVNAIKNTRPYFIALIGDRYGWTPDETRFKQVLNRLSNDERAIFGPEPSPCSVTEMEIMLGAIGSEEMLNHSCFCFRDFGSYSDMTSEDFTTFVKGAESKEATSKLQALKNKIKDTCVKAGALSSIIDYTCSWNSANHRFEHLEDFAAHLENRILEDLIGETSMQIEDENPDSAIFDNFFASNAHQFVGRRQKLAELRAIIDFVTSHQPSPLNGLILHGPSGVGKSYFLSALTSSLNPAGKSILLTHAAGLTPGSVKADSVLRNWSNRLSNILGIDSGDFKDFAAKAQKEGYRIIALIDSLDSFALGEDPLREIPAGVFVVATSLTEEAEKLAQEHQNFALMSLEDFDRVDAEELIDLTFSRNFKELSSEIREALLSKYRSDGTPAHASPLWLNLALTMLMELGDEDFRAIHNISSDASQSINQYLLGLVKSFPAEADALFTKFVEMSCRYFDPDLTIRALTYIALAPFGIEERQLEAVIGDKWDPLEFESLRQWFGSNLRVIGSDRVIKFSHNILRTSLIDSDNERIIQARARLNEADWHDYLDGHIDLDELVCRLIYRSEYDAMRIVVDDCERQLSSQGVLDFALAVMKVLQNDVYTVVRFVDKYFSLFNHYDLISCELRWVDELRDKVSRSKMPGKEALVEEFSNVTTRYQSRARFFNGNRLDFNDFISSDNDFESWRWVIDANIRLYGYRITEIALYWVFAKRETRLIRLSQKVHQDVSLMPEFIEQYVEAIDFAEKMKLSMPDEYGKISDALNQLNGYLNNVFIGWSYDSHPYHHVQVELAERMKAILDAPFPVTEMPPMLTPGKEEVEATVREYESLFHPTEMIEEVEQACGASSLLAQAEIKASSGDEDGAMQIIGTIPAEERFTPPVLDWLFSRFPKSDLLMDFYQGRYVRILLDILRGEQVDDKEISRLTRIYDCRGEKETAVEILLTESEILMLRQMEITFKYANETYDSGQYICTVEHIEKPYQRLIADLFELGYTSGAVEALRRWIEICDLTYIDEPDRGAKVYEWAEKKLIQLGLSLPGRRYKKIHVSSEISDKVKNILFRKHPSDCRIHWLYANGSGDVLKTVYSADNNAYSALFNSNGELLSKLDEYQTIIDFGYDEFTLAGQESSWKFLRRDGQAPFDEEFQSARKFSEGLAAVAGLQRHGWPRRYYWGFIDENGKEVIPRIYEEVGDFHFCKAWAVKNGRYGVIDTSGKVIVDFDYDMITSFYQGHAFAFRNGEMCLIKV